MTKISVEEFMSAVLEAVNRGTKRAREPGIKSVTESVTKGELLRMKRDLQETKREIQEVVKRGMEEMLKHLSQGATVDVNENPRLVREEMVKRERQEMKRDMQEMVKRVRQEMKRDMQDMVKRGMEEMLKLLPQISSTEGARADLNENPRTPYFVIDHQNKKSEGVEFQTYYKLEFVNKLHNIIFTKDKIKDEDGGFVQIKLINTSSRQIIEEDPLSTIEIKIHVLPGDFGSKSNEEWTKQEFIDNIVVPKDGRGKLVKQEQKITLRKGVGTMDDFSFLDNSSWIRGKKVRLGARVLQSTSNMAQVIRINEGLTEPFAVLDHRGKIKHLKKIVKDDKILHEALIKHNICTVSALRQIYKTNRDKLKEILGRCSDSEWAVIAQLACVVDDANSNPSHPTQVAEAYNPATTVLAGMKTNCNRASSPHRIINSGSEASSNNNGPQVHSLAATHTANISQYSVGAENTTKFPGFNPLENYPISNNQNNNGTQAPYFEGPDTPNNVVSSVNAQYMTTFLGVSSSEYYPISNNQNNNGTQVLLSAEQHTANYVMPPGTDPIMPTSSDGNNSLDFSFLTDHPPNPDRGKLNTRDLFDC